MVKRVIIAALVFLCCMSMGCTLDNRESLDQPDYSSISGMWTVSGVLYEGKLIELSQYEQIAKMYDAILLKIEEDGSFLYIDYVFYEGQCQQHNENEFILPVSRRYTLDFVDGEVQEIEKDNSTEKRYRILVVDEGVINMAAIDPETGLESADIMPMQLKRQTGK